MTSGSALFDTNILIDLFSGRREAKQALEAWPPQNAISLITWMEVMVGAKKYHQEQRTRMALSTFNIINISQDIAERSVALRQVVQRQRGAIFRTRHSGARQQIGVAAAIRGNLAQ